VRAAGRLDRIEEAAASIAVVLRLALAARDMRRDAGGLVDAALLVTGAILVAALRGDAGDRTCGAG